MEVLGTAYNVEERNKSTDIDFTFEVGGEQVQVRNTYDPYEESAGNPPDKGVTVVMKYLPEAPLTAMASDHIAASYVTLAIKIGCGVIAWLYLLLMLVGSIRPS